MLKVGNVYYPNNTWGRKAASEAAYWRRRAIVTELRKRYLYRDKSLQRSPKKTESPRQTICIAMQGVLRTGLYKTEFICVNSSCVL